MFDYGEWNQRVERAVEYLRDHYGAAPQVMVVLSGGMRQVADALEAPVMIDAADVPGFPRSSVQGHSSRFVLGNYCGVRTLVSLGRVHYYEGLTLQQITLPLHAMARWGVQTVCITNSAGGISRACTPGELMLISDHINMLGDHPLRGIAVHTSNQFPDMTNAYDRELRALAKEVAAAQGLTPTEGVYLAVTGPTYETPAEIRAFRVLGADAVGMSTVPEVIVANFYKRRVLGVSCITNLAADLHPGGMTHHEVLDVVKTLEPKLCALLLGVIQRLGAA